QTLWILGYPDQALKRSYEMLTLAQELASPLNLVWALGSTAVLHQIRREGQIAQERAEATVTLSAEQGFPFWVAWGTILRGWTLAEQERREEGIAQLHQGIAACRATGAEHTRSYHLALLTEACREGGQAEEGLSVVAEALAMVDKTGERFYEPELYRLRGELTLKQSAVRSSESGFPGARHPTLSTQA